LFTPDATVSKTSSPRTSVWLPDDALEPPFFALVPGRGGIGELVAL
jgi:hypothetical protein